MRWVKEKIQQRKCECTDRSVAQASHNKEGDLGQSPTLTLGVTILCWRGTLKSK